MKNLTLKSRIILLLVRLYVYLRYWRLVKRVVQRLRYFPDPVVPQRPGEKFLWRKLFDHDPRFVKLSDKLRVKDMIAKKFPDIRFAKTLWEGDDPADIPDSVLQSNCVIKTNHGCGTNWFVRDGVVDRAAMEKQCAEWLATRHGERHHEWAYWNIKPRLFVEEMLFNGPEQINRDYKLYMCGGEYVFAYVCLDRFGETTTHAMLDHESNSREIRIGLGHMAVPIARPKHWDRLVKAAARLSHDFDHVRCDLFEIDGEVWFSEYTFYSLAGYEWADWSDVLKRYGERWDIRRSWFLTHRQTGWRRYYAAAVQEALAVQDRAGSET